MLDIKVIYGSTSGNTKSAAERIARAFDAVAIDVGNAKKEDFNADLLILGASTWGYGEMQDDWIGKIALLDQIDLAGKKAAVFGSGDQAGFGDTFVDAVGLLAEKVLDLGAVLIGGTSVDGYSFTSSKAVRDGKFMGLALDFENDMVSVDEKIDKWVERFKQEF